MYSEGKGVPVDLVTAHVWLSISTENGLEATQDFLVALEKNLTLDDIAQAKRLARICIASNYKDCG